MSKPNFLGRQKLLPEPDTIYHDRHKFTLTVSLQLTEQALSMGSTKSWKIKSSHPQFIPFSGSSQRLGGWTRAVQTEYKVSLRTDANTCPLCTNTNTWGMDYLIMRGTNSEVALSWSSKWLMIHIFSWEQKLCPLLHVSHKAGRSARVFLKHNYKTPY